MCECQLGDGWSTDWRGGYKVEDMLGGYASVQFVLPPSFVSRCGDRITGDCAYVTGDGTLYVDRAFLSRLLWEGIRDRSTWHDYKADLVVYTLPVGGLDVTESISSPQLNQLVASQADDSIPLQYTRRKDTISACWRENVSEGQDHIVWLSSIARDNTDRTVSW